MQKEDIKQTKVEQLMLLFDIYNDLMFWIIDWYHVDCNRKNMQGFILDENRLKALGLKLQALLSDMIANAVDNKWVLGTEFYEYFTFDGQHIRSSVPGGETSDASWVHRVCLRKEAKAFPFNEFITIFKKACSLFKIDYQEYFYEYHDVILDDPCKLEFQFSRKSFCPSHISHEMGYWRNKMSGRLEGYLKASDIDISLLRDGPTISEMSYSDRIDFLQDNLQSLYCGHWRLGDHHFTFREIAETLFCLPETVRNWGRRKQGPGGVAWPGGIIINGKKCFPANDVIESMQIIQRRMQNKERNRQNYFGRPTNYN